MNKKNNKFHLTVDEERNMKDFYSVDALINELRNAEDIPLSFNANEISFAENFLHIQIIIHFLYTESSYRLMLV